MRLAPEGRALCVGAFVLAGLLCTLGAWCRPWGYLLCVLGLAALGFTIWFFRDPERKPPADAGRWLLAPADGKVMFVKPVEEPEWIGEPATQVSIFLSPLNVHVNRIPCDGTLGLVRYIPGAYLVAWHEKSSELNERSEIGLRRPDGVPVLFKQIAGAVARRIVFHVKEGDSVRAGERYGIVKFGSRMDVIVPAHVSIHVKAGQAVVAGESILGEFSGDSLPTHGAPS